MMGAKLPELDLTEFGGTQSLPELDLAEFDEPPKRGIVDVIKDVGVSFGRAAESGIDFTKEIYNDVQKREGDRIKQEGYARANAAGNESLNLQMNGLSDIERSQQVAAKASRDKYLSSPVEAVSEIAKQGIGGLVVDAPAAVNKAGQAFSPHGGDAEQFFKDNVKQWEAEKYKYEPNEEGKGAITKAFMGGARAIPLSGMAMASMGAAALAGSVAAPIVAAAGVASLFGGSQFTDTLEKGIASGLLYSEAKKAALIAGAIEGTGETLGDYVGGKFLVGLGRSFVGKIGTKEALSLATDPKWAVKFAGDFIGNMAVQSGTEYGQGFGETAVENRYGISNESPIHVGMEGAKTAMAMSFLMAPGAVVGHNQQAEVRKLAGKLLADDVAPIEARANAAEFVRKQMVDTIGEEKAKQWHEGMIATIGLDKLNNPNIQQAPTARPGSLTSAAEIAKRNGITPPNIPLDSIQAEVPEPESDAPLNDIPNNSTPEQPVAPPISAAEQKIRAAMVKEYDDQELDAFIAHAQAKPERAPAAEFMLNLALEERQARQPVASPASMSILDGIMNGASNVAGNAGVDTGAIEGRGAVTPTSDANVVLQPETVAGAGRDGMPGTAVANNAAGEVAPVGVRADAVEQPEVDLFGEPVVAPTQSTYTENNVVEFPVEKLALSKDVPQFKDGADANGITLESKLEGKYDRRLAAPVQVWERLDGTHEVISGRHRLDLAQRTGETTIPAQIYKESEGFTKDHARMMDLELNVKDGRGKVKDYVAYFKELGLSKEQATARGLLNVSIGRQAYTISDAGSDDLIAAHANNAISDRAAVEIARAAPGNEKLQAVGIQAALEGQSDAAAANLVKAVAVLAEGQPEQLDMLGFDSSALKQAKAMAKFVASKQSEAGKHLAAISGAAKSPAIAKQYGVDVKNPKALAVKIEELKANKAAWDNWQTNPELIAQIKAGIEAAQPASRAPKPQAAPVTPAAAPVVQHEAQDEGAQLDAELQSVLADAGAIMRDWVGVARVMPEDHAKLLPVLVRLFDVAFRKGYYDLKEASRYVRKLLEDFAETASAVKFLPKSLMDQAAKEAASKMPAGFFDNRGVFAQQGSGFALTGQTNADINKQEAAQAAQKVAQKAEEDKVRAEQAAKDQESLDARKKKHAENPENFVFGESKKDALKPMGSLWDQPAAESKPPPEPANAPKQPASAGFSLGEIISLKDIPKALKITLEKIVDGKTQRKQVNAQKAMLAAEQRIERLEALRNCL